MKPTRRRVRCSFRITQDQYAWLEQAELASSSSKSHVMRYALHYATKWPDLAAYIDTYRHTTQALPAKDMTTRSFTLDDANVDFLIVLAGHDGMCAEGIGRRSSVVRAILALCSSLPMALFWGGAFVAQPGQPPQVAETTV